MWNTAGLVYLLQIELVQNLMSFNFTLCDLGVSINTKNHNLVCFRSHKLMKQTKLLLPSHVFDRTYQLISYSMPRCALFYKIWHRIQRVLWTDYWWYALRVTVCFKLSVIVCLHLQQTFRNYREMFDKQKIAIDKRYRELLDDAIQDAVFLSSRNSELVTENESLMMGKLHSLCLQLLVNVKVFGLSPWRVVWKFAFPVWLSLFLELALMGICDIVPELLPLAFTVCYSPLLVLERLHNTHLIETLSFAYVICSLIFIASIVLVNIGCGLIVRPSGGRGLICPLKCRWLVSCSLVCIFNYNIRVDWIVQSYFCDVNGEYGALGVIFNWLQ